MIWDHETTQQKKEKYVLTLDTDFLAALVIVFFMSSFAEGASDAVIRFVKCMV